MKIPKFNTKKELFDYLVANKSDFEALKKSIVKTTDPVVHDITSDKVGANKLITNFSQDDVENGIIKRTIIGNTYGWLDSHGDVHIPNCFAKSISENKNIFHLHDHKYEVAAKVGTPIKIYEQNVTLEALGLNKVGYTQCLCMDSEIKKSYNEMIFDQYLTKQINQHSVGMIYVKLFMCINDPDYKEAYANWNTYKGYVINISDVEEKGYFWAVTEAKLKEISCVLMGSNELTPTVEEKKTEPSEDTHTPSNHTIEPLSNTQKLKYLTENFKIN